MAAPKTKIYLAANAGRITAEHMTPAPGEVTIAGGVDVVSNTSSSSQTRLGTEDLYPEAVHRPPILNSALTLLHEAEEFLGRALTAIRSNDAIASDDEVTKFAAILPELFCLREIGDGFGLCVSSMYQAHRNRAGEPLTEKQIIAMIRVVRFARKETFCSFDAASDLVEALVDAKLDIDPPVLAAIGEVLDA